MFLLVEGRLGSCQREVRPPDVVAVAPLHEGGPRVRGGKPERLAHGRPLERFLQRPARAQGLLDVVSELAEVEQVQPEDRRFQYGTVARDQRLGFDRLDKADERPEKGGGVALKGEAEGTSRHVARPGGLGAGDVSDGIPRCVRGAEPVDLNDLSPQVDAEVVVKDDVGQAQRHTFEDRRVVVHRG